MTGFEVLGAAVIRSRASYLRIFLTADLLASRKSALLFRYFLFSKLVKPDLLSSAISFCISLSLSLTSPSFCLMLQYSALSQLVSESVLFLAALQVTSASFRRASLSFHRVKSRELLRARELGAFDTFTKVEKKLRSI